MKTALSLILILCFLFMSLSCASWSKTAKGATIGAA